MSENWIRVAAVKDVPEDGTLLVRCGGEPVCLYDVGGRLHATHDICTHGQASLADGFINGENIECPLHQGLFHIPTGKAVGAPCTVDLIVYPLKVHDGSVYITASGEENR
jgi:nitrite reductase/ring-hydroxylating ferredoxin subunit